MKAQRLALASEHVGLAEADISVTFTQQGSLGLRLATLNTQTGQVVVMMGTAIPASGLVQG